MGLWLSSHNKKDINVMGTAKLVVLGSINADHILNVKLPLVEKVQTKLWRQAVVALT